MLSSQCKAIFHKLFLLMCTELLMLAISS
uniref:Uncharacterized protein n=1 Tax=Arundo donax TaxID=35708 RepID=A0A0A9EVY3_ARUDO